MSEAQSPSCVGTLRQGMQVPSWCLGVCGPCVDEGGPMPPLRRVIRSNNTVSSLFQEEREADGTWVVVLEPNQLGSLGVIMRMQNRKGLLCVEEVESTGPAATWNKLHPEKRIHAGDMVIEVNGVRGNLQELAAECRRLSTFHLRLQRPTEVCNVMEVHDPLFSSTHQGANFFERDGPAPKAKRRQWFQRVEHAASRPKTILGSMSTLRTSLAKVTQGASC